MSIETPPVPLDDVPDGYRRNAGVVLISGDGLVFAGERTDQREPAWQMPQGGIDGDEPLVAAALRELQEETGVDPALVDVLDQTPQWLVYDLPPKLAASRWRGRYRGQAQKWVALRFNGNDGDIDLNQPHPEFASWRWMQAAELAELIVPFKRSIYRLVFDRFRAHLAP